MLVIRPFESTTTTGTCEAEPNEPVDVPVSANVTAIDSALAENDPEAVASPVNATEASSPKKLFKVAVKEPPSAVDNVTVLLEAL